MEKDASKAQKAEAKAIKQEAKAKKRHEKMISKEYKAKKKMIKAQNDHEKILADLQKAKESVEVNFSLKFFGFSRSIRRTQIAFSQAKIKHHNDLTQQKQSKFAELDRFKGIKSEHDVSG